LVDLAQRRLGIIVGSRVEQHVAGEKIECNTPYGRATYFKRLLESSELVIVKRHAESEKLSPHQVNYWANMWLMKELAVEGILTTNACGIIRLQGKEMKIGDLAVVGRLYSNSALFQFGRILTMGEGDGIPKETPYDPNLTALLLEKGKKEIGARMQPMSLAMAHMPEERHATHKEVLEFKQKKISLINQTGACEALLANELKIPIATLAIGVSYAVRQVTEPPYSEKNNLITSAGKLAYDLLESVATFLAKQFDKSRGQLFNPLSDSPA